ncbi:unnamed protein product [Cunninghamella blakesleeana]
MHDLINLAIGERIAKTIIKSQRAERIKKAVIENDYTTLKNMAREPDGFIYDSLRRFVWPILLKTQQGYYIDEKGSAEALADPIQISKDVERSLYYYPQDITPIWKSQKQQELHSMIVEVLWRNPRLKYYQGFHDIYAMLDSFDPISKQLRLMISIVEYEDIELMSFLERHNIMPYYALSWVLTWFSHDLVDFDKITRLFDLFISSSSIMPLYVSSAITLIRRDEFLIADPECLHSLISHIPQNFDIEQAIQLAIKLEKKYSSLQLQKRSGIWLHDESSLNTWEKDWGIDGEKIPNRLHADKYLGNGIPVEIWENELLEKWITNRRRSLCDENI